MLLPHEQSPSVPILSLRGFGISYHERVVLCSITLDIPATGCVVLLGPAGTGKSSLLRTLGGYNDRHPGLRKWGDVHYCGNPLSSENQPALMLQQAQLFIATVLENLQAGIPNRAHMTRTEQIAHITAAAEQLGESWIVSQFGTQVGNLSLLQQRVVTLLHTVLGYPSLLMLDEPTTGMSEQDANHFLQLIRRMSSQRAILVVLHNLAETRYVADKVILIASGVVQEIATTDQFFGLPTSEAARQFIRTGSCPEYPRDDEQLQCMTATLAIVTEAKSAACGPRGFVWLLPGQLAGTPLPGIIHSRAVDLEALRNVGVTYLVNLTEEAWDHTIPQRFGIRCHEFPVPDMRVPSTCQAEKLCTYIDRWLQAGEVVALHCHAGLGRTGTLLATYWLWCNGGRMTAKQGIEQIRRLNNNMIQSSEQIQFLNDFAQRLSHANYFRQTP